MAIFYFKRQRARGERATPVILEADSDRVIEGLLAEIPRPNVLENPDYLKFMGEIARLVPDKILAVPPPAVGFKPAGKDATMAEVMEWVSEYRDELAESTKAPEAMVLKAYINKMVHQSAERLTFYLGDLQAFVAEDRFIDVNDEKWEFIREIPQGCLFGKPGEERAKVADELSLLLS